MMKWGLALAADAAVATLAPPTARSARSRRCRRFGRVRSDRVTMSIAVSALTAGVAEFRGGFGLRRLRRRGGESAATIVNAVVAEDRQPALVLVVMGAVVDARRHGGQFAQAFGA
jgi:hypothetical protein